MEEQEKLESECETSEGGVEVIRYDTSIYDTPFSKLPDQKRVWLGSPSSTLEGLGLHLCPLLSTPNSQFLGRLSILTPDVISAAATEVKTGRRVGLVKPLFLRPMFL
jgi:hypothetical protein